MLTFNTGRQYSPQGQRIAATAFDGGVVMVDIDRGIDYFLPGCELTRSAVLSAYDNNRTGSPADYAAYRTACRELELAAAAAL